MRSAAQVGLAAIGNLPDSGDADALSALRRELGAYWRALEPILGQTPTRKPQLSPSFLRREVMPRRLAVLSMASRIDRLSEAGLLKAQENTTASRVEYLHSLRRTLGFAFLLAVFVAGFSIVRTSHLERQSERERVRIEQAEEELRRLSQKLLRAQEAERKSISRELHDEIGQKLTALRMGIGRLEKLRSGPESDYQRHVADSKALAEGVLRAVRDLAMGLRPSMLDDLGLGAAVDWQAREFSKHTGVPASVELQGDLDGLPESVRTCAYRVVQEALTNCARHADAESVRLTVCVDATAVRMEIKDDGVGFESDCRVGAGLGLIGMGERVRELGGALNLSSVPGRGTMLKVIIPVDGKEKV
jgi:signal transduction histidine kinase